MRKPTAPAARAVKNISAIMVQSAHRKAALSPNPWSCRSIPTPLTGCECGDRMTNMAGNGKGRRRHIEDPRPEERSQVGRAGLCPPLSLSPEEENAAGPASGLSVVADLRMEGRRRSSRSDRRRSRRPYDGAGCRAPVSGMRARNGSLTIIAGSKPCPTSAWNISSRRATESSPPLRARTPSMTVVRLPPARRSCRAHSVGDPVRRAAIRSCEAARGDQARAASGSTSAARRSHPRARGTPPKAHRPRPRSPSCFLHWSGVMLRHHTLIGTGWVGRERAPSPFTRLSDPVHAAALARRSADVDQSECARTRRAHLLSRKSRPRRANSPAVRKTTGSGIRARPRAEEDNAQREAALATERGAAVGFILASFTAAGTVPEQDVRRARSRPSHRPRHWATSRRPS